jgi:hypothetical protein
VTILYKKKQRWRDLYETDDGDEPYVLKDLDTEFVTEVFEMSKDL